jgi:hypothetical protein
MWAMAANAHPPRQHCGGWASSPLREEIPAFRRSTLVNRGQPSSAPKIRQRMNALLPKFASNRFPRLWKMRVAGSIGLPFKYPEVWEQEVLAPGERI